MRRSSARRPERGGLSSSDRPLWVSSLSLRPSGLRLGCQSGAATCSGLRTSLGIFAAACTAKAAQTPPLAFCGSSLHMGKYCSLFLPDARAGDGILVRADAAAVWLPRSVHPLSLSLPENTLVALLLLLLLLVLLPLLSRRPLLQLLLSVSLSQGAALDAKCSSRICISLTAFQKLSLMAPSEECKI